jgi:hypothetical protein
MTTPPDQGKPRGWARLYSTSHPFTIPRLRQGVWYPVVNPDLGDRVVVLVQDRRQRSCRDLEIVGRDAGLHFHPGFDVRQIVRF